MNISSLKASFAIPEVKNEDKNASSKNKVIDLTDTKESYNQNDVKGFSEEDRLYVISNIRKLETNNKGIVLESNYYPREYRNFAVFNTTTLSYDDFLSLDGWLCT